jgi:Helicase associated domain
VNNIKVSQSDITWNAWIRRLVNYKKNYGDLLIPSSYITGDGYKLGNWVVYQRAHKDKLSIERFNQLDNLEGWVWSVHSSKWDVQFKKLQTYTNENGDCKLPSDWSVHDRYIQLRYWVSKQRTNKTKLSLDQIKKLESLRGWTWHEKN